LMFMIVHYTHNHHTAINITLYK